MSTTYIFLQFITYGTPYWVIALFAIFTTKQRATGRWRLPWLANRWSGYGFALYPLIFAAVLIAQTVWSLAGCTGGLIDPISCGSISDAMGGRLDSFVFKTITTFSVIGLPCLSVYIFAELLTRYRNR